MAQVAYKITSDGQNWEYGDEIPSSYCDSGMQMTTWKSELYGVIVNVGPFGGIYIAKWNDKSNGFVEFKSVDSKCPPRGRVTATALGDRLYLAYNADDDCIYMQYTEDLLTWTNKQIGNKYGTASKHPPSICAYGERIYLAHVSSREIIPEGTHLMTGWLGKDLGSPWGWDATIGVMSHSPCLATWGDKLALIWPEEKEDRTRSKLWLKSISSPDQKFSSVQAVSTNRGTTSGVTAVQFKGELYISYRSKNEKDEMKVRSYDGKTWTDKNDLVVNISSDTGMGTYGDRLIISYGEDTEKKSLGYQLPVSMSENLSPMNVRTMNEKSTMGDQESGKEWNIKWKTYETKKSWICNVFTCS